MRNVFLFLLRTLPFELVAEIEALTHDLRPVLKELLEKHPKKIPQMVIATKSFYHLKRLRRRYRNDIDSVSYEVKGGLICIQCELGETDSLEHVRHYRYFRQPRWNPRRQAWREIGVLV